MLFSPGIYEHAATLIDRLPWDVSRERDLLVEAHLAAWQTYQHPLMVVGIDVYNLEPEAYGAVIEKPTGANVPAISRHPFEEVDDLLQVSPFQPETCPRIRDVIAAGAELKKRCPGADVRIPMCGPFALGIGLIGMNELLMAVAEEPEGVERALMHLLPGQLSYMDLIHSAGLKPIIFESGTTPPLLPPSHFRGIEVPLLKSMMHHGRTIFGEAPHCVIGGDAAPVATALFETGPGWIIAPSETDQQAFLEAAGTYPEIHIRVNLRSSILLDATMERIEAEVDRCLRLAITRQNTSVGCGIVPYECRPDTLLKVKDLVEQAAPQPASSDRRRYRGLSGGSCFPCESGKQGGVQRGLRA